MKTALLISASKYNRPLCDLNACEADIELVRRLIEATAQYEEILSISTDTTGARVKAKITAWIEKLQSKAVDEIFFYYTGHGDFHNGEFYFPLTDFDRTARKQTSLTNSEVDSWLRSLNPSITIKVVDACHAGVPYVKDDSQVFEKYLQETGSTFKKCYFMFSSALEQSSYQDNNLSFFTRSFLRAIQNHQAETIRYRDVIDFISDDFANNSLQTPFFVIQAHNTEVFCSVTDEVRRAISASERPVNIETPVVQENHMEPLSLKQFVERDAEDYCDENEFLTILEQVKGKVEKHEYSREFSSLYDIGWSFDKRREAILQQEAVGKWLEQNVHQFFAEPTRQTEQYEAEVPARTAAEMLRGLYKTVTKYREVVDGFRLTVSLSYESIQILATPKYPNLFWSNCSIVLLPSKTRLRFFYYFADYRDKNWHDRELITDIKWQTVECKLHDLEDLLQAIENIQEQFATSIIVRVKEKFGVTDDDNRKPA